MKPHPTCTPERANDTLDAYAKHLGIKRTRDHQFDFDPLWDGEKLPYFTDPADTAHEIAHWILASDDQRKLENYGWYFDWSEYRAPGHKFGEKSYEAPTSTGEILACLLGFSMMIRSGLENVDDVYDAYSFFNRSNKTELMGDTSRQRASVQPHVSNFQTWLNERESA